MENLTEIIIIGAIFGLVVEIRGILISLKEKVETLEIEIRDKNY